MKDLSSDLGISYFCSIAAVFRPLVVEQVNGGKRGFPCQGSRARASKALQQENVSDMTVVGFKVQGPAAPKWAGCAESPQGR